MRNESIEILRALQSGRKLRRTESLSLRWEDGVHSPSLRNAFTSELFQAGLIAPEYREGTFHTPENATGYIILSAYGKCWLEIRDGKAR